MRRRLDRPWALIACALRCAAVGAVVAAVSAGCGGVPVSIHPDPLPSPLHPSAAPAALQGLDHTLTSDHVRAEEGELIRVLRLSDILERLYADLDGWLSPADALAEAVLGCVQQQQRPADGRVALLCGWLPWPYDDLRPPLHWLTLPHSMSLVEQHSAQGSADAVAESWRRRDVARRAALQAAIAYHELWLEFAVYSAEAAYARQADDLTRRACAAPSAPATPATPSAPRRGHALGCAVAVTLTAADGPRLRRLRARWALRSDILVSFLHMPAGTLIAPTRDLRITPRVRTDDLALLLVASLASLPSHQAVKAEQRAASLSTLAHWWALTGIVVGGVENPVIGGGVPVAGFTMIIEPSYFREAWIQLQGARAEEAVRDLHADLHAQEVAAALSAALDRLDASHRAALDALATLRDAEARAASLRAAFDARAPDAPALPVVLSALGAVRDRRAAASAAVLHYNLSHVEVLAALGHLTPTAP